MIVNYSSVNNIHIGTVDIMKLKPCIYFYGHRKDSPVNLNTTIHWQKYLFETNKIIIQRTNNF